MQRPKSANSNRIGLLRTLIILATQLWTIPAYPQTSTHSQAQIQELALRKIEDKIQFLLPEQRILLNNLIKKLSINYQEKLISIINSITPPIIPALVNLLSLMDELEIQKTLDEMAGLPRILQEEYIKTKLKVKEKIKESSEIEKFYLSGGDFKKYYEEDGRFLRQIGYDIAWPKDSYLLKPQFVSEGYILGPGDSLLVYIWGKARLPDILNFPLQVTVLSDGRIFIPMVGPINVGGLTIEQASEIIKLATKRVLGDVETATSLSSIKSIPVIVMGEVANPGIIALSGTLSIFDAISLAGGIKKSGSLRNIEIKRQGKTIGKVDLYELIVKGNTEGIISGVNLRAWDTIFVPKIGSTFAIKGSIKTEGIYEMGGKSIKLKEALEYSGGTLPESGKFRVRILRYEGEKRVSVSDEIIEIKEGEPQKDFEIQSGDVVEIFPAVFIEEDRKIMISGYVRSPGIIPYFEGFTLKDAVALAGGFKDAIPPTGYELIRKVDKNNEEAKTTIFPDGKREMKVIVEELEKIKILPYDKVTILPPPETEIPRFIEVEIIGEVKFPSRYIVQKGERLYDVLKRAGGFTDKAFPEGIVFLRDSLAVAQKEKLELVSNLLTKELLGEISYYAPLQPFSQTLPAQRTLAEDRINLIKYLTERAQARGRIVVKVTKDLEELRRSEHNIELENGDKIFIPSTPSFVVVAGEVKNPSTFSYVRGKSGKFYINQAGGFTKYANTDETYIIRASGETSDSLSDVKPGDTIVVPPKIVYPYQTWYIVRDALSLIFQGASASALMYNAIKR